jgi:chromosome segregation ATPase
MKIAQKKAQLEQDIDLKRLAQRQRRQEYNKSMTKHAEYPSIPEFQNKFRDRHERDLAAMEEAHKEAVADFNKATEKLAASLAQALPLEFEALVQRHVQGLVQKPTGVDEARIKALETSLEQKIGSAKNEVKQAHDNHRELKASLVRERYETEDKLARDIEKRLAVQFEQKMAAQQKVIDGLLDNHKHLTEQLTKVQNERITAQANSDTKPNDVKAQVERLETRQNVHQDLQQEQTRSLRADFTKISIENGRLRDDLEYLRETVARRSEVAALKTDYHDVKAENVKLSALISQIKDDNRDLGTRFTEYADMTQDHQVTVSRLNAASQEHQDGLSRLDVATREQGDELSRLAGVTREHQDELSRLDLTMLEQVAEGWGIEWPNVLSSVQAFEGVRDRVEKLEQVYPDVVRYRDHLEHVKGDAQLFAQTVAEVKDRVGRLTPTGSGDGISRQGSVGSRNEKEDFVLQDLRERVSTVKDKLRQSEERVVGVEVFVKDALVKFGQVLDNVTRRVKNVETRLGELPARASTPSQQDPEMRSRVENVLDEFEKISKEFELTNGRLEFLKDQVKQLETRFEELPQQAGPAESLVHSDPEVSKFKTKVAKFEGDFEKLSTEVQGVSATFEYLNHQITNLDNQYNNITTKPLAEHILAHMELVYPNNREIIANMQELQLRMYGVEQEGKQARESVEELRRRVNVVTGQQAAPGQPPNKRRRMDEGANGSSRPSLDVSDRSTSSPAARE